MQCDLTCLKKNLAALDTLLQKHSSPYDLSYDLKTQCLFVYLDTETLMKKDNEQTFQMLYDMVNLMQYDDSVFVRYSQDRQMSERLKTLSFPVEFG